MKLILPDGNVNASEVIRLIRQNAKDISDSIYYCFNDLSNYQKITALKVHKKLTDLADKIEKEQDDYFR